MVGVWHKLWRLYWLGSNAFNKSKFPLKSGQSTSEFIRTDWTCLKWEENSNWNSLKLIGSLVFSVLFNKETAVWVLSSLRMFTPDIWCLVASLFAHVSSWPPCLSVCACLIRPTLSRQLQRWLELHRIRPHQILQFLEQLLGRDKKARTN